MVTTKKIWKGQRNLSQLSYLLWFARANVKFKSGNLGCRGQNLFRQWARRWIYANLMQIFRRFVVPAIPPLPTLYLCWWYANFVFASCWLAVSLSLFFCFYIEDEKKQSKNETTLEPSRCVSFPWVIDFFLKKFWTECNLMRFLFHFFCTQNWCDLIPIFLMQTKVDEAL